MNIDPEVGRQHRSPAAASSAPPASWSSGNNLTSDLQALNPNLTQTPGIIKRLRLATASVGGPIMKDRLWFYGSYRNLDTQTAHGRHRRQCERRRCVALGLGRPTDIDTRLVQDRQMIIGRAHRPVGQEPHPLQLRVPAPLRGHAAHGGRQRLPQPRRRLDRARQQLGADPQMSPEATSTAATRLLRRAVLHQPGHLDDAGEQQAAVRGRLSGIPLPADLRLPAAGRHHQSDSGDRAVECDQSRRPGIPFAPVANYRYRGVEEWGPAKGKTDDIMGVDVLRDRRAQRQDRLPVPPTGSAR